MSGGAARLRRLLAIRKLTEDLDRGAVQTALMARGEVENAQKALEGTLNETRVRARVALADGDRNEWMMADAQTEVACRDRRKLKKLADSRKRAAEAAMAQYLQSRREHEQVKQLVEDAARAKHVDEVRRSQAAADEWFLSRRVQEL